MNWCYRLVAAALLSPMLNAAGPESWIPVRWPGGATLDLLRNTPFNCLLVNWNAGSAFASAAHERGLIVLGVIHPQDDVTRAAAAAAAAGLDGLVLDGDLPDRAKVVRDLRSFPKPVIPLGGQEWFTERDDWPVLGTNDAVTARVREVSASDTLKATPTSEPWIDSNTWFVLSLRAWSGARPVWLGHRLENPSPQDYVRAVMDAGVAGGRWVVSLDDVLLAGLREGNAEALSTWNGIGKAVGFLEQQREWRSFAPAAALVVVQDRASPYAALSAENLNLINRRRIPFRVLERANVTTAALEGVPAVLATDLEAPSEKERLVLAAFAKKGGLLMEAGKEGPPDPESLAREVQERIGNDALPVRLFNVSSVLAQVSAPPDRRSLLLQLVNYASAPSENITLRAARSYRRARLFSLDAPAVELQPVVRGGRTEVRVAKLAVYAAVLLEE